MMFRVTVAATVCMTLALCATASAEVITPEFRRSEFSSRQEVTNPYFPLAPGTVLLYEGHKEGQVSSDRFEVTHERKRILGVSTTVVHDQFFLNGKLHESTIDWYAEDKQGNVWYFGEQTEELTSGGEVENTEGSWQAGARVEKHGPKAQPGIFMPGKPEVGVGFRQEIAPEVSEDEFEVLNLNASVSTPYVTTNRALQTKEFTPLEPEALDNKYFALGIGTVIETTVVGPEDHLELVSVTRP